MRIKFYRWWYTLPWIAFVWTIIGICSFINGAKGSEAFHHGLDCFIFGVISVFFVMQFILILVGELDDYFYHSFYWMDLPIAIVKTWWKLYPAILKELWANKTKRFKKSDRVKNGMTWQELMGEEE